MMDLRTSIEAQNKITLKDSLKNMGNLIMNLLMMF